MLAQTIFDSGVGVVSVVSVWQNIPCRVQRQHVVRHLRHLLSAARLSTGSRCCSLSTQQTLQL